VTPLDQRIRKLAATAARLNAASGRSDAPAALAFVTDRRRCPNPFDIVNALPKGAAVILRDYADPNRPELARRLAQIARERGLLLFVGADAALAREIGAAGVHLRSDQLRSPPGGAGRLVSASCHSAQELARAADIGAGMALLGPVFPTASHPGAPTMGVETFRRLAAASKIPVLAIGGVGATNALKLAGRNVVGIAAIGAFTPSRR
jgi:thiamine-phosphate pyrophosphorylase